MTQEEYISVVQAVPYIEDKSCGYELKVYKVMLLKLNGGQC